MAVRPTCIRTVTSHCTAKLAQANSLSVALQSNARFNTCLVVEAGTILQEGQGMPILLNGVTGC